MIKQEKMSSDAISSTSDYSSHSWTDVYDFNKRKCVKCGVEINIFSLREKDGLMSYKPIPECVF